MPVVTWQFLKWCMAHGGYPVMRHKVDSEWRTCVECNQAWPCSHVEEELTARKNIMRDMSSRFEEETGTRGLL